MDIVPWAPMSATIERDLQDLLGRLDSMSSTGDFPWKPSTDLYRENGSLVLKAELPGIDPKSELSVDVEDNVLHIHGEKAVDRQVDEPDRLIRERQFGSFNRDLMLPDGIDAEDITANYDNGILTVMMPIPAGAMAEPRRVKVDVTSA